MILFRSTLHHSTDKRTHFGYTSKPDEIKMLMAYVLDCNNHKHIQQKICNLQINCALKRKETKNDVKVETGFFFAIRTLFFFLSQQALHFYTPLTVMIL